MRAARRVFRAGCGASSTRRAALRSCARSLRCDRDARVLSGVARELEVGLLERDPARHELFEPDLVGDEQLRHPHRRHPLRQRPGRARSRSRSRRAFARTVIAAVASGVLISTRSPDAAAISSSTETSASSRPLPITISWSAVPSSSLIRWLDTNTVRPSAANPRSVSRIHWIPSGSRPIVGSSRIRIGGSPRSAAATPRRCLIPSEKAPARRPAALESPTRSSTWSTRPRDPVALREPAQVVSRRPARMDARPHRAARRRPSAAARSSRSASRR